MKDDDKLLNWLRSCYDDFLDFTSDETHMLSAIAEIIVHPKNYCVYLKYRYKALREFLNKLYLNKYNKVLNDIFYFDAVVKRLDKYYYIRESEAINIRKDKTMGKDNVLLNCWYRIWSKVSSDGSFMHPEVPKKFDFIEHILKGHNVDTSKYTHLELINFIDNITKCVDIADRDWPLITRIVICVNTCYEDVNSIENKPNTPKGSQKELLEVLRSIWRMSDFIKDDIFGASKYCDILQLDPDEIIAKYNNYIKTCYKIGDEICLIGDPNVRAWITKIEPYTFECLFDDGTGKIFSKVDVKKTGRHNVSLGCLLQDNMESCIILEEDK